VRKDIIAGLKVFCFLYGGNKKQNTFNTAIRIQIEGRDCGVSPRKILAELKILI
jgi:hypothetical protein